MVAMTSRNFRSPNIRLGVRNYASVKIIKAFLFLLPVLFLLQAGVMFRHRNDAITVADKISIPHIEKPAPRVKEAKVVDKQGDEKGKQSRDNEISSTSHNKSKSKKLEFVHITKTGGSAIEKAGAKQGLIWGACHFMNFTEVGCMAPDVPYTSPNYQSYALTSPWHTPPKLLKRYVDESQYPYHDADLFVVVRNPYDRIMSEYYCPWVGFQAKYRGGTFEEDANDPAVMNKWVKKMVTNLSNASEEFFQSDREHGHVHDTPRVQSKGVNEDNYVLAQKHFVNQAEYIYDGDKVVVENVVHYEHLSKEFDELMEQYGIDSSLPPKGKGGTYTDTENKKRLTYRDLDAESIGIINKFAKPDFEKLGYHMVESKFDEDYSLEAPLE